jgi:hypothetical protein
MLITIRIKERYQPSVENYRTLEGIKRMVDEDVDCSDILIQLFSDPALPLTVQVS